MKIYFAIWIGNTIDFIERLPEKTRIKINSAVDFHEEGDFKSLYVKTLSGPIRELIVKRYRIIFFIYHTDLYLISGFVKKTAETPKREIEKAEKLYKTIISNNY